MGDTIDADDFKILGDAYSEYFELQNDGTYRLIATAEDLKKAIDAIENKKALENIKTESENIKEVEMDFHVNILDVDLKKKVAQGGFNTGEKEVAFDNRHI